LLDQLVTFYEENTLDVSFTTTFTFTDSSGAYMTVTSYIMVSLVETDHSDRTTASTETNSAQQ